MLNRSQKHLFIKIYISESTHLQQKVSNSFKKRKGGGKYFYFNFRPFGTRSYRFKTFWGNGNHLVSR